jgi:molybdopterin synthase sulfur carrier subunit
MPIIFIPAPLRELTGGQERIDVPGKTFGEAIDELDRRFPGVKGRLIRDGQLIPGFQVSVNDVLTKRGLQTKLEPASEVHILPAIGGG